MAKRLVSIMLASASLLFLYGCQRLFFYPMRPVLYNPEICSAAPENIFIAASDNLTLHGWLFKTKKEDPKGTVIFYHGNANNLSTESLGVLWLLYEGYDIFTIDYRGYGISQGKPSIKGILQDGLDAIDAFMEIKNARKDNLILYGQSLGGAVAAYAAANSPYADKFKVLVLESTFTSWRDMAREAAGKVFITWMFQYPISWSFPKDMASKELLGKSKIKDTVIIHSKSDRLINVSNAEILFKLAKEPKELILVENAEHARIFADFNNRKLLTDYLDKVLNERP